MGTSRILTCRDGLYSLLNLPSTVLKILLSSYRESVKLDFYILLSHQSPFFFRCHSICIFTLPFANADTGLNLFPQTFIWLSPSIETFAITISSQITTPALRSPSLGLAGPRPGGGVRVIWLRTTSVLHHTNDGFGGILESSTSKQLSGRGAW